jgi:hypothetical protein
MHFFFGAFVSIFEMNDNESGDISPTLPIDAHQVKGCILDILKNYKLLL